MARGAAVACRHSARPPGWYKAAAGPVFPPRSKFWPGVRAALGRGGYSFHVIEAEMVGNRFGLQLVLKDFSLSLQITVCIHRLYLFLFLFPAPHPMPLPNCQTCETTVTSGLTPIKCRGNSPTLPSSPTSTITQGLILITNLCFSISHHGSTSLIEP